MTEPVSRIVADSRVEMTEIVMPNDANPLGNAMGGRVMHWIDVCAAVCAGRHARTPVVTASVLVDARCATEFTHPDYSCILQQPSLL